MTQPQVLRKARLQLLKYCSCLMLNQALKIQLRGRRKEPIISALVSISHPFSQARSFFPPPKHCLIINNLLFFNNSSNRPNKGGGGEPSWYHLHLNVQLPNVLIPTLLKKNQKIKNVYLYCKRLILKITALSFITKVAYKCFTNVPSTLFLAMLNNMWLRLNGSTTFEVFLIHRCNR